MVAGPEGGLVLDGDGGCDGVSHFDVVDLVVLAREVSGEVVDFVVDGRTDEFAKEARAGGVFSGVDARPGLSDGERREGDVVL